MKFKEFLALLADPEGFIPTYHLRWVIRQNDRNTAREEAIVAEVLRQANPRSNITSSFPWGPEQSLVLQQLWSKRVEGPQKGQYNLTQEWRDVPIHDADKLFTTHPTKHGPLPVPNSLTGPEEIQPDFKQRLGEILGDDYYETDANDS